MTDNKQQMAVGIDLGTTNSVVACLDADNRPWTVLNAEGDLTTPSVVFFDRGGAVVGKEAVKAAEFEPERIAQFAKRDMGDSSYHKSIRGEQVPPEVIEALVLKKLKHDAELKLGSFHQAVVTVPAYFNEPRRKATQDAGRLAGLEVLDIINEPTAAAISYGVQKGFLNRQGESGQREFILVYDLGGGTFDATLMEIEGQNYKAVATAGDVYLGGLDFDRRIVDHIAERFEQEHGVDPRQDAASLESLSREAEDAKRALSARNEVTVHFAHEGKRLRVPLSRETFESLTGDLLDRTLMTIRKVLREAGCQWGDLTRLLLVGGSSRMPMVSAMLTRETGLTPDRSLSPDEAIAHGAAIYAGLLLSTSDARSGMSVRNVNSHDLSVLGIERNTGMKRRQVLIPRNTPLPATGTKRFKTYKDSQKSVAVNVIEGGDASGKNATPIGKCVIDGLPAGLPAKSPVDVGFHYAENGRLTVEASLPSVGKSAALTIQRASGLSEQELVHWARRVADGMPDENGAMDEAAPAARATDAETAQPSRHDKAAGGAAKSETAATANRNKPDNTSSRPGSHQAPGQKTRPVTTQTKPTEKRTSAETPAAPGRSESTTDGGGPSKPTSPVADADDGGPTAEPGSTIVTDTPSEAAETAEEAAAAEEAAGKPGTESETQEAHEDAANAFAAIEAASAANATATMEQEMEGQEDAAESEEEETEAEPPPIAAEEDDEEIEAELQRQERRRALQVLAINTLLHAAVLMLLALIILPPDVDEQFEIISSRMAEETEEEVVEEVSVEQPEEIDTQTEAQVVTDLTSESDDQLELDINDLTPSTVQPEPDAVQGAPAAEVTGEMGGRSQAARSALVAKHGGNAASEAAVEAGLQWLARHQNQNGSWSFDHTRPECKDFCTQPGSLKHSHMGATAMALLAYMGAGHTYADGEYYERVGKALDFLMANIKPAPAGADLRGAAEENSGMYIQGLCTIALCEALAMNEFSLKRRKAKIDRKSGDKDDSRIAYRVQVQASERLRQASQQALNFIMHAQASDGGWRYTPQQAGDTSVVGWQVMALTSGHTAGLKIAPGTLRGVNNFLNKVQSDGGARYGYTGPQPKPSTTAIGLLCRMYLGWKRNTPALQAGVEYLGSQGPATNDMYYNYYATQVMHHYGGEEWEKWNSVMRDQLVNTQRKDGHAAGSWDLADKHGGKGGRLYMTSLCTMTLEVYYRHLPLYQHTSTEQELAEQ